MQDAYFIGGKMAARLTLNGYSSGMSGCFGVFDGHGGDRASRYCAEHLFPKIQEEIEANKESKIDAAITTAVHAIGTNERACQRILRSTHVFLFPQTKSFVPWRVDARDRIFRVRL